MRLSVDSGAIPRRQEQEALSHDQTQRMGVTTVTVRVAEDVDGRNRRMTERVLTLVELADRPIADQLGALEGIEHQAASPKQETQAGCTTVAQLVLRHGADAVGREPPPVTG